MTTYDIRHLFLRPIALAVGTACVAAVAAAQQPAQQPVDRAALDRQTSSIAARISPLSAH
jgi:hypothetical protein